MQMLSASFLLLLLLLTKIEVAASSFVPVALGMRRQLIPVPKRPTPPSCASTTTTTTTRSSPKIGHPSSAVAVRLQASSLSSFSLDPTLTEERTQQLFAWIACAMDHDRQQRHHASADTRVDATNEEEEEDAMYEDLANLALPAIFGVTKSQSTVTNDEDFEQWQTLLQRLKSKACQRYPSHVLLLSSYDDALRIASPAPLQEQERNAMGPLGAGQWLGQYPEKFAHSILKLQVDSDHFVTDQEWIQSLPRTCRQTIGKVMTELVECQNNNSGNHNNDDNTDSGGCYELRAIQPNVPAPQSTYHHFRCVIQHQVRLAEQQAAVATDDDSTTTSMDDDDDEDSPRQRQDEQDDYGNCFFNSILEGVERFVMSLEQCGSILEYRSCNQQVIAFCHLIAKGQTIRGQWFYASDEASRMRLLFHAIWYMVHKATEINHQQATATATASEKAVHGDASGNNSTPPRATATVTAVDLGPNGIDGRYMAHAKLKQKYGFELYEDWPKVADYRGSFWSLDS